MKTLNNQCFKLRCELEDLFESQVWMRVNNQTRNQLRRTLYNQILNQLKDSIFTTNLSPTFGDKL